MSSYTSNLNLLKKDPATDGNDTFNIKTMPNDNWDKIDEFCNSSKAKIAKGTYVPKWLTDEQVGQIISEE